MIQEEFSSLQLLVIGQGKTMAFASRHYDM